MDYPIQLLPPGILMGFFINYFPHLVVELLWLFLPVKKVFSSIERNMYYDQNQ